MGTGKSRKKRDFLSIIMSFIVMIELILSPCEMAFAASENYPNTYTIKVVNSKGEPITGAKVECTVYADAEGRQEVEGLNPEKIATDTNGVVSSAGISKRLEQEEKTYYKITAVSLYGYENYKDTEVQTVDKKNVLSERKITLKEATVNLTGKVVNQADQQPLAGVKVTDGNTSTYTDTDGKYSIGLTFGKEYQITFEVEKFDSVTKTVSLTKENVTCDVKMQKTPVYDPNFKFEKETSKAVIYGENGNVFQNKAETTSTEQTQITYKITSEKNADGEDADVADIDANTGEVKIKTAGEICVEAVRSGDETYDATTISYRLKILKAKQTGVKFKDAVPEDWKTLNGNYKNILVGGESIGKVTYKLSDGENYADINSSTGEVTFKDAGTIEVTATKGGDSCYEAASCTYRITAIREKQEGFKFAATKPSDLIYGEKNTYQNQASGGKGTGAVSYRIIEGNDVADIDAESGEITIKKAGTIKVQAEKKADLYYDGVTAEYTLNILKGSQKPLLFTEVSPEITWNENSNQYTPSVEGGSGDGEVSYQIQKQTDLDGNESDEIANIDETTGIITWKTTGIVTVKAIKSEDDCYNEIETTCTVIMKRAKQNIKFSEKTISLVYGMKEFQQEAKEDFLENATDGTGYGTGKISYSIVEGDKNPLGAEIDETTGTVTFADSKTGTIWVKAVKEADACYESCESKYMITVSWMQTPQNPYTLEGEKFNPEKEWYTGNVKILAPEGYQISSNNAFSEENLWSDEIVYQNEGISDFKIYLREKESGGITDGILISNIRIDKTNPESLQISYKEDSIIKKIGNILFGKNKVTVVLTAKDTVSGIETFAYQYVNNEISTSGQGKDLITVDAEKMTRNEDGSVSYQFDIEPQFRGNVSFKATDYAGRTSELSDAENTVVVDNKSPDVKVSYLPEKGTQLKESVQKDTDGTIKRDTVAVADENTRFIYDGAVKAKIEVKEANLYTDDVVLNIKRDGETIWNGVVTKAEEEEGSYAISEWSVDEESDEAVCEVVLKADGDYEIGIENYADRSKNDMKYDSSEYEGKTGERSYQSNIITIDTTAPEMTVSYDNNDARNGNYYQADRTATIQVKDRNFRPSEVQFAVETEDVQGNPVEYETSALNSWTDWKQVEGESDVWQAQIQFDSDARYKAEMSYIDLAGHGLKEDFADEFVVDKEKPDTEGMQISYSEHIKTWQKVLHAVTFGYYTYQTEVEVTLQAEDPISGIDYLNWSYSQEENTSKTNVKEKTGKIETNDLKYSEDGKTAVGTFKLKASEEEQFRGSISFTATDRAGNESDVKADHTRSNIVDNISPEVKISYAPDGEAKLKAAVEKDTEEQISRGDVADPNESTRFIYDGNVKATIQVQEANFFDKDLILTIVRDNETIWDGAVTEQKEEKGSYAISGWETQGEDTVSCDVILKKDGDYQLYIKYTDSSENKMQYKSEEYADKKGTAEYESNIITVDTVKPEVSVVYDNNDANNGNYYKADRTATIQIKDRNFRPSEVQFAVETEDVQGNPVEYETSALNSWTDWKQVEGESDVWQAQIQFDSDARYKAEMSYIDLAGHGLKEDFADEFVVDKEKPDTEGMQISYSEHIKTWQKVLHAVTFGYYTYQTEVEVTLQAEDPISGIDYLNWSYSQEENTSKTNVKEKTGKIETNDLKYSEDGKTAVGTFKLKASEEEQFRGSISFTATDRAGNESDVKADHTRSNIVDNISPEVKISYAPDGEAKLKAAVEKDTEEQISRGDVADPDGNTRFIYDGNVKATIRVKEANLYTEDIPLVIKRDGETIWNGAVTKAEEEEGSYAISEWTVDEENDEVVCEVVLKADGDYEIGIENYADRSKNDMKYDSSEYEGKTGERSYQSNIITIDTTAPEMTVSYDNNDARNGNYYQADRTATIQVKDRNFRPSEVQFAVETEDVQGNPVEYETSALNSWTDWKQVEGESDVWQAQIQFDSDARYKAEMSYIDLAGHGLKEDFADEFVVDKEKPDTEGMQISYSEHIKTWQKVLHAVTFGYYTYQTEVEVTLQAEDPISGIDYLNWSYSQEENTSKTNVKEKTGKIETNDLKYSEDGKTAVGTFKLKASEEEQFRGSISFTATDRAGNESDVKADHTRSNIVDNISPEVKISYAPDGEAKLKAAVEKDTEEQISRGDVADPNESTRFIYDGNVKATIQVQEANFFDKDLILTIVRDNETIWDGAVTEQKEEKGSYAISGWETQGEDTVSCDVILKKDGDYQLYIKYTDSSENKMQYKSEEYADKKGTAEYESNIITVDTVKPEVSVVYDNNDANNGNYYKADRTATIQIKDRNFRPSEVQFAVETEDVQRNPVTHNHSDLTEWTDWQQVEKYVWEAKVPFKTDARYQAEISYTDLAGHNLVKDFSDAFVVDKKKPDASQMDISYSTHIKTWQKVLHAITFGYYSYQEEVEVTLSAKDDISGIDFVTWTYRQEDNTSSVNVKERTKTILRKEIVFSEDGRKATAKFKLTATEKEQFRGSISFTATDMAGNQSNSKDDSGRINIVDTISPTRQVIYPQAKQVVDASSMKTRSDYNYGEGTNSILYYDSAVTVTFKVTEANFYAEDVEIRVNDQKKVPTDWRQDGDTWTGSIRLSGDGDYVVTMNYTDRSSNQMKTYQSEKIVIDTIEPVIHVNYGNTDVKKSVGKRSYFNRTQTAVVSITEHNFRADDVIAKVTAKDVSGADIGIMDYTAYLSNRSHWTKNGDVYSAYITYDVDANYTFDIEYKDLALRKSADYVEDEFTVDKTAPAGLNISFSNDILDQNISGQAYRFYNQMVTVTISGEDNVAGIEHFVYNYKNANGVSGVNEEVLNAAIENAQITKSGSRFTASFSIPRSALGSANQFNGLVDFMAYDYATNSSTLQDSNRIIVDNIAPTATVTYSKPVQEVNGISYYAGSVEAAVEITEANFYAEDVQISATKDGVPTGISANWTDNSTDVHTGHFTLSGDGDYIITINYTDRSTNKMETYTSKQLTIDTEHPTIHVSNVKANSANKDEVYGFTITAEDSADNFTMDQLKTVLTCISRSADGTYQSKEIALENISTRENNQVYVVQVDNLEEDGIYTLSCSAKDLAGNEYGKIMLDDEKEYDSVSFSINRNGSTFQIDQNTENLIGRYYVYDVANDLVIQEINTDPVENYRVKLNDSELKEGTDYTTAVNSPEDQWSVRTYTIKKELFDTEGEYQVVIDSVDKTDTAAYSDLKGLNLSWVVDQTAPVVTVSGLESKGRYKTEEQTVTAIPTDDGGKLKSFKAVVAEQNVEDLAKEGTTLVDLEGEELENYLRENDGKISFNIPEGYEESVQIVCTDYAFHEETKETNTYKEVFTKVTVSPNNMVIFYANKPLLYSTAAIAVIVMAGGVILIIWIRRTRATKEKQKRAK